LNNTFVSLIQSRVFKITIFFIPIAALFLIFVVEFTFGIDDDFFQEITKEDGLIENETTLAYFISFIFSLAIATFFKERKIFLVLFLILAFGFLFIALEEISWGQRIFNFNTPDWFPENRQRETNIHNLKILSNFREASYLMVSLLGSFTWFVLPKIHNSIFKKAGNNYKTFLRYAVPSKYLISYFIPMFPLSFYVFLTADIITLEYLIAETVFWNILHHEVLELILSIGILLFVLHSYVKLKWQSPPLDNKMGTTNF